MYRRELLGAKQSPDFFDHDNKEGVENRLRIANAGTLAKMQPTHTHTHGPYSFI